MRAAVFIFCAASLLLVEGCIYVPPVWDLGDEVYYVGEIQEGVTTREEVLARLGKPHREAINTRKIYYSGNASGGHVLPLLCAPLACRGRPIVLDPRDWGIEITFDEENVVQELSCFGSDWCEERSLTKEAETGDVLAIARLITFYDDRHDTAKADPWRDKLDKHLEEWKIRARNGELKAYKTLISFYRSEDDRKSLNLWIAEFGKLARTGDPEVMYEYGVILDLGSGSERLKWFCLAAHAGNAKARLQLGKYFHLGLLQTPRTTEYLTNNTNKKQAYLWYSLSLDAKYNTAVKTEIEGLSKSMTPFQITEAERLVAEWRPNPAECEEIAGHAAN